MNPYEFVRYRGKPYPQTHPERLATMAVLNGLEPQDIHTARVLEIGCCDGANLIPMAMALPSSHFVGIDLTETDINEARETVSALGLANIEFQVMDLVDLPGPLGQFDYIIAHGIYSWLPADVREKLLAVISNALAPGGIAFVSYNANPGGHVRKMVREMMLFHLRDIADPEEKIARAREFLEFLRDSFRRSSQPELIRKHVDFLLSQSNHVLFHDDLAECYQQVYFHEFADHAARCGLQYLSESSYFVTRPESVGSDAAPAFAQLMATFGGNPVPAVQYMDFVRFAYFHQTLLYRSEAVIDRVVRPERLKRLRFLSSATLVEAGEQEDTFEGVQGSRITIGEPRIRQLLRALIDAYPRSIAYGDLPDAEDGLLLALMNVGIISPTIHSPDFCLTPGERPVASPLARWQAANSRSLTDLRHSRTWVESDLQRAIIPLLDGTRTREALLAELPGITPELLAESLHLIACRCLLTA